MGSDADSQRPDDMPTDQDATPIDNGFGAGLAPLEPVREDTPEDVLLDARARSLDEVETVSPEVPEPMVTDRPLHSSDEDVGEISYEVPAVTELRSRRKGDWECELSAHNVAVELRHIETEVRSILDDRDPRRKRKLGGTSRWQELEDDLITWRYAGRFDETTLDRLRDLVNRRNYLFRHLRFLASTRPTWNS